MTIFPREGQVLWIGVRPERRMPVLALAEVMAITNRGLDGDRYRTPNGKRQVTLMQAEHLSVIAALLNTNALDPSVLRRNLLIKGINVLALKSERFRIGQAVLEGTGPCPPCSRMEEVLGLGGYNATRGHGGITARILRGGMIRIGDGVQALSSSLSDAEKND